MSTLTRCPKKPIGKAKALTNPSAHFVRDAAYVFAHALHNIWEKVSIFIWLLRFKSSSGLQLSTRCLCWIPWGEPTILFWSSTLELFLSSSFITRLSQILIINLFYSIILVNIILAGSLLSPGGFHEERHLPGFADSHNNPKYIIYDCGKNFIVRLWI